MKRLIDLFFRHRFTLLFLILQTLSLGILYSSAHYQRSKWTGWTSEVENTLFGWRSDLKSYFSLKEWNEQLRQENAVLRSLMKDSHFELYSRDSTDVDTLRNRQYLYRQAQVINNSIALENNTLTLDKGRVHGVLPGMGVLSEKGIVGVVLSCSAHYSTVLSLLHSRFSTSGRVRNSSYFGRVFWPGSDHRRARIEDVPVESKLDKGDLIYSSSHSSVFPPDQLIGTVALIERTAATDFLSGELELSVDFADLNSVYVVQDLMRAERDSLESLNPAF